MNSTREIWDKYSSYVTIWFVYVAEKIEAENIELLIENKQRKCYEQNKRVLLI